MKLKTPQFYKLLKTYNPLNYQTPKIRKLSKNKVKFLDFANIKKPRVPKNSGSVGNPETRELGTGKLGISAHYPLYSSVVPIRD